VRRIGSAPIDRARACASRIVPVTAARSLPRHGLAVAGPELDLRYYDHDYFTNPAGYSFEDATVELVDAHDVTLAVGHIHWRMTPDGTFLGVYTLGGGSGALAGVHATGAVTYAGEDGDGRPLFDLDGTYHTAG
jgi:hypothetical protein